MPDAYSVLQLEGGQVLSVRTEDSSKDQVVGVGADTDFQGEEDHQGLKWAFACPKASITSGQPWAMVQPQGPFFSCLA